MLTKTLIILDISKTNLIIFSLFYYKLSEVIKDKHSMAWNTV